SPGSWSPTRSGLFRSDQPIGGSGSTGRPVDRAIRARRPRCDPVSVIEVEHLRKTYGTTVAVDDVSFTVAPGEIFGILGRNGAGKTTTVECVVGLRRPDGGQIRVLGRDPLREHAALTRRVGVQLQDSRLPARLRVGEAMRL